jgi:cell division protein FtsI/penicillin-binding protein 2
VSQTFEPGSVLKGLSISAAVDLNRVSPNTTFEDNGPVWYSGHKIDNWDGKHHGTQNIVQLLQKSNNIGAAWVAHQVGAKKMHQYFTDFGLGSTYGISLEGEDTGILREYRSWTDIDLATSAFGQGISATPLQILNGFNSIANGGYLLQPRVVSKIIDSSEIIEIPTKSIRRVLSKETSETMIELLEKAAEEGEAKFFVMKNYRIAGKTGTAQIPEEGEYSLDRTNATFAGFMAEGKEFSMIVKLEEPRTSYYAAETAVPLWMDIATELVKYFGIPPDKARN